MVIRLHLAGGVTFPPEKHAAASTPHHLQGASLCRAAGGEARWPAVWCGEARWRRCSVVCRIGHIKLSFLIHNNGGNVFFNFPNYSTFLVCVCFFLVENINMIIKYDNERDVLKPSRAHIRYN